MKDRDSLNSLWIPLIIPQETLTLQSQDSRSLYN